MLLKLNASVPLSTTEVEAIIPVVPPVPSCSVPPLMVVVPVKVESTERVRVPAPCLVRPPELFATIVPTATLAPVPPPPVRVTVGAAV